MLKQLRISNFIMIENALLNFSEHLNVISGETGSGKSMLLSSLAILCGATASNSMIGKFAESCIVEGRFQLTDKQFTYLRSQCSYIKSHSVLVYREIFKSKANVLKINGHDVSVKELKFLMDHLTLHVAQHKQLDLLKPSFQAALFSVAASNEYHIALKEYQLIYSQFSKLNTERMELNSFDSEMMELISFKYEELSHLNLNENEEIDLNNQKSLIKSNTQNKDQCVQLINHFDNAEDSLQRILLNLSSASSFFNFVKNQKKTLENYLSLINQCRENLLISNSNISYISDDEIDEIENRLDILFKTKNKYKCQSILELIKLKEKFKNQLDRFKSIEEEKKALDERLLLLKKELELSAEKLSIMKKKECQLFSKSIEEQLKLLSFDFVYFKVVLVDLEFSNWSISGVDDMQFMISFNKGQTPMPLNQFISGGELSRLLLAFQGIIQKLQTYSLLVFDEIDTGLGGFTANTVADYIVSISHSLQILLVTHLPQIAMRANKHLMLMKDSSSSYTRVHFLSLNESQKKRELNRMVGGNHF